MKILILFLFFLRLLSGEVWNESEFWVGLNDEVRADPQRSVSSEEMFEAPLPPLTIVTRSGFRPGCFNKLQASLAAQSTSDFSQIVSNDANRSGFKFLEAHKAKAQHDFRIVNLDRADFWTKNRVQCASSRYLNALYGEVARDSWIMTLDDDSRLLLPDQIERVRRGCARSDPHRDVVLQDAYMWTKRSFRKYPNYTESHIQVDTANFIFHASAAKHLDFGAKCGGDKMAFQRLLDNGYKPKFLRQPAPGVWANYAGPAHQRLVKCDLPTVAGPKEVELIASDRYQRAIVPPNHQRDAERYQVYLRRHHYKVPKPPVIW